MNGRPQTKERGLLDTSVVIASDGDYMPGVLAISAATLAELHFGVLVASSAQVRAERLRRMSLLQRRFDALPLDEAVAAMSRSTVRRRGWRPASTTAAASRP